MLQIASADHQSWRWPPFSTLMGMRHLIGRFSMRVIQNLAIHTRHSWEVRKFQIFTSKMHCYVTWDTFVFLQASEPRWYGKHTTAESLVTSGLRKQWQYCKSISIGWTFDKMLGSTSDPALLAPLPNQPSRSKVFIPCYLPLVDLGNPSPWITCRAFLLLSMEMTVFSWSSTDSRRWQLWQLARRISQQKPLLNSSLNECGCTLGSHSLSYQIRTVGSWAHFGLASIQC